MSLKEMLARSTAGVSRDEIDAHCSLMPGRYFQQNTTEEMALHVRMIHRLLQRILRSESDEALHPVVEWTADPERGLSGLHVVTWDRAGLFSKMAGSVTVAGLHIVTGRAYVRSDNIVVVQFDVVEPESPPGERPREVFHDTLRRSLTADRDILQALVMEARYETIPAGAEAPGFPPKVFVYRELSLPRAIVEVEAVDRRGLLYHLSGILFRQGYNITFARITTHRGVASDTFHIESSRPAALSPQHLHRLRTALLAAASAWENGEVACGTGGKGTAVGAGQG